MSMFPPGVAFTYRRSTKWLDAAWRPLRRKRTRDRMTGTKREVLILRERLQRATIEISEWRWKVGGSMAEMKGTEWANMVKQGMRDRGYEPLPICDEDLSLPNKEPGDVR